MDNVDNPKEILIAIFTHLRKKGFELGVGELLAALQAVDELKIKITDKRELCQIAKLIWCKSQGQITQFELIWEDLLSVLFTQTSPDEHSGTHLIAESKGSNKPKIAAENKVATPAMTPQSKTIKEETIPDWKVLPVCAPEVTSLPESQFELNMYWPLSRRSMTNNWRYLRHPVADGPKDVLDVQSTVKQFSLQGFFLAPTYQRRKRNNAHVLLFIDQEGSMEPLHRFTRDLAETLYESTISQIGVFYFHNIITPYVYLDSYMTKSVELEQILEDCSSDSSILIVSDAGASRGYRQSNRIGDTSSVLHQFKRHTPLVAWLNPMPKERWADTSAEIIARLIPMFQMDSDGLSKAIDVLRGQ